MTDDINQPAHYNQGDVECIQAIEASLSPEQYIGYLRGNVQKYLWRFDLKDSRGSNLKKAIWYSQRLLAKLTAPDIQEEIADMVEYVAQELASEFTPAEKQWFWGNED